VKPVVPEPLHSTTLKGLNNKSTAIVLSIAGQAPFLVKSAAFVMVFAKKAKTHAKSYLCGEH